MPKRLMKKSNVTLREGKLDERHHVQPCQQDMCVGQVVSVVSSNS
jgi:hypothetical protein